MAYESGKAIALCRNLHPSMEIPWPKLKNFSWPGGRMFFFEKKNQKTFVH